MIVSRWVCAIALVGCVAETEAPPTDASGMYRLESTFDVSTNAKIAALRVALVDMTADPAALILNRTFAALPDGLDKTHLGEGYAAVLSYVRSKLSTYAPSFASTLARIDESFGEATHNFGLNHTLALTASGDGYDAVVSTIGLRFTINGGEIGVPFAAQTGDLYLEDIVSPNVRVTLGGSGELDISDHRIPMSVTKVIRTMFNKVIIAAIDSSAKDLAALMVPKLVDCGVFGTEVAYQLKVLKPYAYYNASDFTGPCIIGMAAAAAAFDVKITDPSALDFGVTGTAHAVDTNADHKVDTIENGTWTGTLLYASTTLPLGTATFTGERM